MERLTRYFYENSAGVDCEKCGRRKNGKCNTSADCAKTVADRLAAIEDILGDTYDLDRLRELVEADRNQEFQRHLKRFDIMPPKKLREIKKMDEEAIQRWLSRSLMTNGISEDRLRELCEAERDGRCVVLPCKVGDKMKYIDDSESLGVEVVQKIVVEVETDSGIYSSSELSRKDFEAAEAALKGERDG